MVIEKQVNVQMMYRTAAARTMIATYDIDSGWEFKFCY